MRRFLVCLLAAFALTLPAPSHAAPSLWGGLGAWVDIFDGPAWRDPEGTVASLHAQGVRTLYLETASYRFAGPIRFPAPTGRFLDAAHVAGIRVVGWYVPALANLRRDLDWSLAAIRFASPGGQRFDGFALDIEVTKVRDHAERSRRVVLLSQQVRAAAGPGYPLGAIIPAILVPSSGGGEIAAGFWSNFPYAGLAPHYDAILPMAYWTYRVRGPEQTRAFIARSAELIRTRSGRPDIPIHMIGGLAAKASPAELRAFADATRDLDLAGGSLYDAATTSPEKWAAIASLRSLGAAPKPAPPAAVAASATIVTLPKPPGGWALDPTGTNLQGGDRVAYTFPTGGARREVFVRGFDVGENEVVVVLNGRVLGALPATPDGAWGPPVRLFLATPSRSANRISFDSVANPPASDPWGIAIVGTGAIGPI